jgi:hypothetical protein
VEEIQLVQSELKVSHGCFEKFKKYANLQSTNGSGENIGVYFDAALLFPAELEK